MHFGMSQHQTQELSQEQLLEQTHSQRLALRLSLIGALHGEKLQPKAKCPGCGHMLTALEIMKGFLPDPHDFTTGCPRCKKRFGANLAWSNADSRMEVHFYCAAQTREMMRGMETLSPEEFKRANASIYHSAIAHHGTLKNAFNAMGIAYAFDEVADAKTKIEPFLGKLFDTTIAALSGVDVKVVRRMRKSARIPRCLREGAVD